MVDRKSWKFGSAPSRLCLQLFSDKYCLKTNISPIAFSRLGFPITMACQNSQRLINPCPSRSPPALLYIASLFSSLRAALINGVNVRSSMHSSRKGCRNSSSAVARWSTSTSRHRFKKSCRFGDNLFQLLISGRPFAAIR